MGKRVSESAGLVLFLNGFLTLFFFPFFPWPFSSSPACNLRRYKSALTTSTQFMHARTAGARQKEKKRLKQKELDDYAERVLNTSIPVDYDTKSLLRKEIRRQARLELTAVEMDEIERLWARESWPNRKPSKIKTMLLGGESNSAAVRYGNHVKEALDIKLNRCLATNQFVIDTSKKPVFEGNKYPDMPVDPGTYAHLFEDDMTDYSRITTGTTDASLEGSPMPDYDDDDY